MGKVKNQLSVPRHVAIIMDGNGRWASQRGKERSFGHQNGRRPVQDCVEAAIEAGVECLTLYAFSTENWKRPGSEISFLMHLLADSISDYKQDLIEQGVRLKTIGDLTRLPDDLQFKLQATVSETSQGENLTLVVALNYGGRNEIVSAAKAVLRDVVSGDLLPERLDEQVFSEYLFTSEFPDVELLVRTSGEQRLSNFLLWQSAYAELLFTKTLWPDFTKEHFLAALDEFARRNRRFGAV